MRKLQMICVLLLCLAVLAGCSGAEEPVETNAETAPIQTEVVESEAPAQTTVPVEGNTISALPETIDLNKLENCTLAVSLNQGDAYVDDEGSMQMKLTVYTYDLYDLVDVANLQVGDSIIRQGEAVKITELTRNESGTFIVNGGLEKDGFELWTDDETVYYEVSFNDAKNYYALGEATVRVSGDFIYTDAFDPHSDPTVYYPGDFLTNAIPDYNFTPYNTSIIIENGMIVEMNRVFAP